MNHGAKKVWMTRRKLKESSGHPCALRVAGKKCKLSDQVSLRCRPPWSDHDSLFLKDGKAHSFVTQPYSLTTKGLRKILAYCDQHGLDVTVTTWPSWHYPGSVLFLEYTRRKSTLGTPVENTVG